MDGDAAESRYRRSSSLTNLYPNLANGEKPVTWGFLSGATGGQALELNAALPAQLAAIAREQDEYYRLSYTPPPANEGTCHALRVKVNVRGLATRARNEYCTEKPVDLVAGRIVGQKRWSRAPQARAEPSAPPCNCRTSTPEQTARAFSCRSKLCPWE